MATFALGVIISIQSGCENKKGKQTGQREESNVSGLVEEKVKPPEDPLVWCEELTSCADGTYYVVSGKSRFYWLIEGKAIPVDFEGQFIDEILGADMDGGVYVISDKHLFYVKSGKATKVRVVKQIDAPLATNPVLKNSLLWSILSKYGGSAYKKGLLDGRKEGYETGHEEGYEEGREAGEK